MKITIRFWVRLGFEAQHWHFKAMRLWANTMHLLTVNLYSGVIHSLDKW